MRRRLPKGIEYAQDGPKGRPRKEIMHQWISAEKRRTHKRERQEGKVAMALDQDGYPISDEELMEDYLREMRRPPRPGPPPGVPETTTARAFNGHLMVYPFSHMRGARPEYSQSQARCADNCDACAGGDTLPDW